MTTTNDFSLPKHSLFREFISLSTSIHREKGKDKNIIMGNFARNIQLEPETRRRNILSYLFGNMEHSKLAHLIIQRWLEDNYSGNGNTNKDIQIAIYALRVCISMNTSVLFHSWHEKYRLFHPFLINKDSREIFLSQWDLCIKRDADKIFECLMMMVFDQENRIAELESRQITIIQSKFQACFNYDSHRCFQILFAKYSEVFNSMVVRLDENGQTTTIHPVIYMLYKPSVQCFRILEYRTDEQLKNITRNSNRTSLIIPEQEMLFYPNIKKTIYLHRDLCMATMIPIRHRLRWIKPPQKYSTDRFHVNQYYQQQQQSSAVSISISIRRSDPFQSFYDAISIHREFTFGMDLTTGTISLDLSLANELGTGNGAQLDIIRLLIQDAEEILSPSLMEETPMFAFCYGYILGLQFLAEDKIIYQRGGNHCNRLNLFEWFYKILDPYMMEQGPTTSSISEERLFWEDVLFSQHDPEYYQQTMNRLREYSPEDDGDDNMKYLAEDLAIQNPTGTGTGEYQQNPYSISLFQPQYSSSQLVSSLWKYSKDTYHEISLGFHHPWGNRKSKLPFQPRDLFHDSRNTNNNFVYYKSCHEFLTEIMIAHEDYCYLSNQECIASLLFQRDHYILEKDDPSCKTPNSNTLLLNWFLDILEHDLTIEQQRLWISFISGSSYIQVQSPEEKIFRFCVVDDYDDHADNDSKWLMVRTCSRMIVIPRYSSRAIFSRRLLQALEYSVSHGMGMGIA
jgi:hypothetical protein